MAKTNIDILAGVAGEIEIFGETHNVLDLNAEEFKIAGEFSDLDHLLDVIERLVPTVPRARLAKLTPKQLGAVYGIGMGVVKDVEGEFPNGSGPAPSTTAPA